MIGVAARLEHRDLVTEFFELFKTPWEWFIPGKQYDVVLSADGHTEACNTRLALVYGVAEHPVDRRLGLSPRSTSGPVDVQWQDSTLPLYQGASTFRGEVAGSLVSAEGGAVDYRSTLGSMTVRRVGYDLFGETAALLSSGQPKSKAPIPTLELHIALLRCYLDGSSIAYVEVPPQPYDADFLCCLTHDVDFFGIRRHAVDSTLAGFVLRGTIGTLGNLLRGSRPFDEAIRNWRAVLTLPLVFARIRADLWDPFRDYTQADRGHKSTFFLIPFKNRPGITPEGATNERRSVAYSIQDVKAELQTVPATDTEFAVHGIDAWRDTNAGRAEKAELTEVTGQRRAGVRMHWLYFSDQSPSQLEEAGFDYDSSSGYNDAIGFKAGTLQAFRPPGAKELLELPLSIMDTAMFFPDYMGLTQNEAAESCRQLVQKARQFGGALVINWHDRSLAPERQWRRCYEDLLNDVEEGGGWFAKAGEAVEWFRWRRSIRFSPDRGASRVTVEAPEVPEGLPPARLVISRHGVREASSFAGGMCSLAV